MAFRVAGSTRLGQRPMGVIVGAVVVVVAVASLQLLLTQSTLAQVTDGDEQFQAYHQDIGRISGSNSPVAPQTVVSRQQAALVAPPSSAPATRGPTREHQHRAAPQQPQQLLQPSSRTRPTSSSSSSSSSGRVTLTMRQHHAANEPLLAPIEPVFTQLIAPPQFKPMGVAQPSSASEPSEQVQPTPSVQHSPTQFVASSPAPATSSAPSSSSFGSASAPGPALTSFRSGLSNSVSARHSALMAQVAAERQQAAAVASPDFFVPAQPVGQQQQQGSLGSPIGALSQPTFTQVQPPQPQPAGGAVAASSAQSGAFVDQPDEPLVAPSFEHVLQQGCPAKGVFSYENKDHCDRYYICTNGTFTEEACPNGLAYSQLGAVYQHCAYNWRVDCGNKKTAEPLASPGCPWQFGIFPVASAGRCSIDYFVCEWGVPETKRCQPEGLFYDDRIKGCQWADQLGCKSEALLNFKCPPEDEDNPYWPYPRYYHTNKDIIVCVSEQPRLVHCNEDQLVDPSSLACLDVKKKKKNNNHSRVQ